MAAAQGSALRISAQVQPKPPLPGQGYDQKWHPPRGNGNAELRFGAWNGRLLSTSIGKSAPLTATFSRIPATLLFPIVGRLASLHAHMITFLHGRLVEATPTQVTVDVHGVGYEVSIPLSSFDKLPVPGAEVRLLTHLAVREDAHVLYGFMTAAERDMFRLLIHTVSGIGPKIALSVLSGMNVTALRGAVANGDVKALSQISGVGRKTAERIVVELKDKVGPAGAWEAASSDRGLSGADQKINDAVLALVSLGFKQAEAHETVRAAQAALGTQASVEELVRASLKKGI